MIVQQRQFEAAAPAGAVRAPRGVLQVIHLVGLVQFQLLVVAGIVAEESIFGLKLWPGSLSQVSDDVGGKDGISDAQPDQPCSSSQEQHRERVADEFPFHRAKPLKNRDRRNVGLDAITGNFHHNVICLRRVVRYAEPDAVGPHRAGKQDCRNFSCLFRTYFNF
jgi:hypothetical protein